MQLFKFLVFTICSWQPKILIKFLKSNFCQCCAHNLEERMESHPRREQKHSASSSNLKTRCIFAFFPIASVCVRVHMNLLHPLQAERQAPYLYLLSSFSWLWLHGSFCLFVSLNFSLPLAPYLYDLLCVVACSYVRVSIWLPSALFPQFVCVCVLW